MTQGLKIIERSPANEVAFGQTAAKALMDVVRDRGLAKKFGGQKEHLEVEAWELLGQFTGLSAKVYEAEPITIEDVKGAKARVVLVDKNGVEMGGAIAYCMRDEPNWKNKPWFQLASMAQTRAVSKAFRIKLAWIAVLAGYSGTPAEEMDGISASPPTRLAPQTAPEGELCTEKQATYIQGQIDKFKADKEAFLEAWDIKEIRKLPKKSVNDALEWLTKHYGS